MDAPSSASRSPPVEKTPPLSVDSPSMDLSRSQASTDDRPPSQTDPNSQARTSKEAPSDRQVARIVRQSPHSPSPKTDRALHNSASLSEEVDDSFYDNKWWEPGTGARKAPTPDNAISKRSPTGTGPEEQPRPSTPGDIPHNGVQPRKATTDESEEDDEPLTITLPPHRDVESDLTPKTPADRVRFILAQNEDEEAGEEVDFTIHALFCQMDVLCHFEDGDVGWKEASRWLKYEEKVEDGNRWSKPHVSTTSLHALFEIRKGIADNTTLVILDMKATHGCLHQVAEMITQAIVEEKNLPDDQAKKILEVLTSPHKHKDRGKASRKVSELQANQAGRERDQLISTPIDAQPKSPDSNKKNRFFNPQKSREEKSALEFSYQHTIYPQGLTPEHLKPYKPNKRLLKKIPGGSEVANILVGQEDGFDETVMIFVRLDKSAVLADMTEVALPTRFIFVVLGPSSQSSVFEYMGLGRAAAALLTDRVFCEVAYKANSRQDLLDGIDEFIDDLTVLPPSIWDPSTRMEPPQTTVTMEKLRKRLMSSARHAAGPEAFHFAESAGEDESLKRTGRLFGGLVQDIKNRYSLYASDIKDGCALQCVASVLFLYFACITPIVTFGGLLGHGTDGMMSTMETILAGAICGTLFALFSGQPLIIVGATGPLLVFETILYHFCHDHHIHFLSFRFWIGMWIVGILMVMVVLDLSALVRYITRFTEESFAVLISLIFIYEAFFKLRGIWDSHPIHVHAAHEDPDYKCHCLPPLNTSTFNMTDTVTTESTVNYATHDYDVHFNMTQPPTTAPPYELRNWTQILPEDCITHLKRIVVDTRCLSLSECKEHGWRVDGPACDDPFVVASTPDVFFLSCFLFIGTFVIAIFFRNFRGSQFFPSIVRSTLADFAVLLAIVVCTGIDVALDLNTPKLRVPETFQTTIRGRGWIVNPMDITAWWIILVAGVPAILATILIFLDQQITAVIVNRKEHKLKKPTGYHLDLLVLAVTLGICSLMGLPWFVAATVRSVTHVRSLIRESELRAPGERTEFLGVREQRVTGFFIHILIGVSVLITVVLKHIPMPVLYGVFLYMGVTSLSGVQFVDRILILFMPEKYQPDYVYLRHVQTRKVHVFTIIQIICMLIMWVMKSIKLISIAFPMMILALCFIRKGLECVFTQSELFWLDHIFPEKKRREVEDKDIEMKEIQTDDEEKQLYTDTALDKNVPMEDAWAEFTMKRDYGLGRPVRERKLSKDIIKRYQQKKVEPGDRDKILNEVEEESEMSLPTESTPLHKMSV